ncbi:long-chain fatty acid--CoA ligase [Thermoactinomyces mirandus]|uniref:Long-chain fatty acid--CoA ligase n=1 Tax=Thermoactinomyces mirandus TaxID=2756294 RepID=A0A7W1XT11_9BACL|nr:long-chain fatty acid--CoA ligase [Thermoactinomyces mirandus]MBA4602670.1 long-chain fatty acid--CoA ligase [Thermoactinomyces mirandus]
MKATMMDYPLTLPHLLERAGKLFRTREIVSRMPDRSVHRYTYGDFYRRARLLANALKKAGLKRGDRVGTLMWNHYVHLEAYFGVPVAGGVVHTLNLRLYPEEIAYMIRHAKDRFLIIDNILLPFFAKFRNMVNVEKIIVVPLTDSPVPSEYENYEQLLGQTDGCFSYPELNENEAAGMSYTSGTTGKPKGVVYTHRALVLHSFALALRDSLGISEEDSVMPVVPMFHVNAWGLPFACTMMGARQVLPGPHLDPASLLELMEKEKVTVGAGVPTVWLGVLQELTQNPDRWNLLPDVNVLIGGSAAPESLIRGLKRHNLHVLHGWGMTETTPVATISRLRPHLKKISPDKQFAYQAKQGVPVPFVELRIVNENGEGPWDGRTMGELQVRGPWIAGDYYNRPDCGNSFTEDGWLRTGDVACIDPDGYVKITDRTKDLIKSGGEWISSVDLENALMDHSSVAEAAVIAMPHPKWQERPLAIVVLKEGEKTSPEELRKFLASKFSKWWLPDQFVFADEIPRTSAGKFSKAKLRERYVRSDDQDCH